MWGDIQDIFLFGCPKTIDITGFFKKFCIATRTRPSLDASRVPGSFFYFAFSLAFVAGIYFVTQTHVGAKSALLLFSNCDPLRWVRSWRAALRAFFDTTISI